MNLEASQTVVRSPAGWILFAIAGLISCGIAGGLLDLRLATHLQPYRWGPDAEISMQRLASEKLPEANRQLRTTAFLAGAIALGCLAGALTLGLCLVDAAKQRRISMVALTPIGTVVGAAAGAAGGYLAVRLHYYFEQKSAVAATMTEGIMIQAAAWTCAGVGVALGVWLVSSGSRKFLDTIIGGLLAGLLVGAAYPPIAGYFFTDFHTDRLFPEFGYYPPNAGFETTGAFLFWAMFTGTLYAAVLGCVSRRPDSIVKQTGSPVEGSTSEG